MTGSDDLRIGDAERTRVTEALHDHFAQGRLTQDELEARLDATLAAKTAGDLRQVTHDLPQEGTAATPVAPPPQHRRHRPPLLALSLLAFLAIALLHSGPGWALLGVVKVIFLIWLVTALLGFMRIRRRRRHWHAYGWRPGQSWEYGSPRGHWRR